jgi:hypothetical protein
MTRRAVFVFGALAAFAPVPGRAQGVLSVEIVNGYSLVVDSNVTAPSTYAPRSAYIGARVCNAGNAPLANVIAHVGDYSGGVGDTPGVFPSWSSAGDPWPFIANTGSYSLKIEADATGVADGTRYVGTLAAGQCRMEYWLFSYPQCVNVSGQPQSPPCDVSITGDVKPTDDVRLDYDVWATTTTAGVATAAQTRSFTMRNEISAAANKIWPNNAAKVPPEYLAAIESVIGWGTLGPDGQPLSPSSPVYPGQRLITTQGIWYDLGNVGQGFDNDGDLVPDQNAWLQPVGDPGAFDADCFRMVNVYGIVIVKLKTGGELLIPFQNRLYFEHVPDNTGVVGLVYYQFLATDEGCSADMTPYQEAASGFDNEKFSADYGLGLGLASGSYGPALSFTKTDGVASTSPGSTLTYTLALPTNTTGVNLGAPEFGTPLVFREKIPAGTTFVAGSADDAPATNLVEPTGMGSWSQGYTDRDGTLDTCTIQYSITTSSFVVLYSGDGGTSWTVTEPGVVTDVQWLLLTTLALDGGHDGRDCVAPNGVYDNGTAETSLPAGKTASVSFQVTVNAGGGPVLCNTGRLVFGSAAAGTDAEDCTLVTGNNSLSGTVFEDDGGTGGVYGNGAIDNATEVGIGAGVAVTLYFDRNGDGKADAGDIAYGSTTTAANGTYAFGSLPDGPFVVVIRKYDGAVSDGLTNAVNDFLASRCSPVGTCSDTAGWGNTTFDPNLPLTTNQGILKLNEDPTTASLGVTIDLARANGTGQAITGVNFGFAPPFRLTKAVVGNPDANGNGVADAAVDEGDVLSYSILLENRLPSVGRQGPTGCQYTVWAPSGVNGTPASKEFTNPGNAWDASSPNRTLASASVTGGGLRFIYGTGFTLADQPGTITKVEGLFFGYFSTNLTDDYLNVIARLGAGTQAAVIDTARLDSYVGEPPDLEPTSAIAWNLTALRPGGGPWTWADDFATLQLEVNPTKTANADQKTFYLDAIGLRITTDQACEANSSTTLGPVPLQDTYDTASFAFVSADPPPTSVDAATGVIRWTDVGPILPGTTKTVAVTVRVLDVNGSRAGACGANPPPSAGSACNWAETAYLSNRVKYADGRPANDDRDSVAVNVAGKGEIRGTIWSDTDNDGWAIEGTEPVLPGVTLTLYACVKTDGTLETGTQANKTCATMSNGNTWQRLATTATGADGAYEFIGLDSGYYLVEVGDTDGSPAGGNASPFGKTQTGEPNDTQDATSGSANGHDCPTCDNIWGSSAANLAAMNLLDAAAEETVNGVNFGYYSATAVLFGNVWHDIDGDTSREPGELGLSGFTVRLSSDPNGDGNPADGTLLATTTSDATGSYAFGGLAAASYVIVVTPPTLRSQSWVETVESTGGTSSLDDRIPVTLTAGQVSGSHDFGYTLADTSQVGDTVYLDFDGDGSQDPTEAGIPNVTVRLYRDVDRDGTIDAGVDDLVATDVTDASGHYLFSDLAAGSYVVEVDTGDPDFPSGATATGDPDVNTARVGDLVYLDANGNGTFDAGENGIAGVVVHLYSNTDGDNTIDPGEPPVAAATTDANGGYLFTSLAAGNYLVEVDTTTLPAGLARTSASFTNVLLATNAAANTAQDAGYSPSSNFALGNRIWHDVDGDDVQDPGEVGLAGIDVVVTDGTGTGCSPSCRATTDAAGFWYVTGLTNGTFTVDVDNVDLPRSFTLTAGTDPRTVTISGADNMAADFGYRYTGAGASPTGTISGRVFEDRDGDLAYDAGEALGGATVNLIDASGSIVGTTTSAADGTYAFTGVFIGEYAVQAASLLGTRYSVLFVSAGDSFPNLNVVYQQPIETVADGRSAVSVDGVHPDLLQDFGFQRFQGSIGDTVYLDANQNGTQDLGEPGFGGVTVNLLRCAWTDANGDGFFQSGERTGCTTVATTLTTADDATTPADESGKYLFTNLATPSAGQHYVVAVEVATLPGTSQTLTADPETDGLACTALPSPDVPGDPYPPPSVCDSEHLVRQFTGTQNYLGADFGYVISDPNFGLFGDTVWIDTDGDGVADPGEPGLAYVTVWMDADNDGVVDWTDGNGNGRWDAGEGERWTTTDSNGYYLFTSVANGTYANVKVKASDLPPGLTQTFEVRGGNLANNNVTVVIAGGVVTSVDGACAGCGLSVDFGFRYAGANQLSGTVCLDDGSRNGYCAGPTTHTGVGAGESPLSGVEVGLYRWTDTDGDGVAWDPATGALDPGDTFVFLGSTTTAANGDYSFANVPDRVVVVAGVPATQSLRLTTTNATSSVEDGNVLRRQLYDGTTTYEGNTVTVFVRQALDLAGDADDVIVDLDFAFDPTLGGAISIDFGDLPESGTPDYSDTLLASGGASHRIGAVFLGAAVSAETDGQPSSDASADTGDDGVTLVGNQLTAGPSGGSVNVVASAGGWLAGWIDFNRNGTFDDALERVVSGPVGAGSQTFTFDVPLDINGGVSGAGIPFFGRFRIYASQPLLESPSGEALSSTFQPTTGEVEDYSWVVNVTRAVISSFAARERSGAVAIEWETSAETGTVGFFLRRWSRRAGRFVPVNTEILPSVLQAQGGRYLYVDPSARRGIAYTYELVEVEVSGRRNTYGPFTVDTTAAEGDVQARGRAVETAALEPGASGYAREPRRAPRPDAEGRGQVAADAALRRPRRRASAAKLGVTETGIHYVRLADLERQGLIVDPSAAGPRRTAFGLTNRGRRVALLASPDHQGFFFHGQALGSVFARDNVYHLGEGAGPSPAMPVRREFPGPLPTGYETFTRTVHAEENHVPATAIFDDPERDFWLWDWVFAGWGPKEFRFRADGVVHGSEAAAITVRLKGSSDTPTNPDHHAVFRLNGTPIGEASWNGLEEKETTLPFASGLLADGENVLEIDGLTEPGVPYSLFYLDSFEVRYPSAYRARGNRLTCPAAGHAAILAGGFTRGDILVFDVTDPRHPAMVAAGVSRLPDGTFGVTLTPPFPETVYEVLTPDAARLPRWVEPDLPSSLRSTRNEGEYLIVTTAALREAAEKLADYRSELRSTVVDLEDVYDEFNFGIPSPHALRRFLGYARRRWEVPPRYVVLAGDGSYDYQDFMGEGGSLVPPMMVGTPHGLYPSDAWFADEDDPSLPGIAVGRLPAASAEELERMIAKIRLREGAPGAPWLSRMVYVADNGDEAGDFAEGSARLAALAPPDSVAERIDVDSLGAPAVRASLLAALGEGAGTVSYVGHGGYDVLADEGLLRNEDVEVLSNADHPTLVTAMTCLANHFALPGFPGLGETLVRKDEGGAAAVWAPTGLSENELAVSLAEGYYAAAADPEARIGDAIAAARRAYRAAGWPRYLPSIYVLLGDPAMRLR